MSKCMTNSTTKNIVKTLTTKPDDYVMFGTPSNREVVSMDDAMTGVFEAVGLPRLGGASGRGWSFFRTMQACMHMHKRLYVDPPLSPDSIYATRPAPALEVGSFMHALLAVYYMGMIDLDYPLLPEDLHRGVLARGADPERVQQAWRLFTGYESHYDNDVLIPLGVEERYEDPKTGNSCRYDAIARVDDGSASIPAGVYIVEHKSASRLDTATLQGWRNDGEIIGQMLLWNRAGLEEKHGPLRGVIVNLIVKTKIPQFERIIIPPQAWQIDAHERDLAYWSAQEKMHHAIDLWPRSRAACVTRYGLCQFFDDCASESD